MKVAYVFSSNLASTTKLATMILPQLERGDHGAEVVGMFFFDDNLFCLRAGDPVGERLVRVASERGMLVMVCDQCAVRRGFAENVDGSGSATDRLLQLCGSGKLKPKGLAAGVQVGCFPQLYGALSGNPPNYVVTL